MISIRLPATPASDLRWEKELFFARESKEKICWEFDLGLHLPYFSFEDPALFQALSLALSFFSEELYPEFAAQTAEISLFRGSADFSSHFLWSDAQEVNWKEWREGRPSFREEHLRRVFCLEVFAHYLQRLSHLLPDEALLSLSFSSTGCGTRAEKEHLLSKERFEHFLLYRDDRVSAPLAVCFPEERLCDALLLEEMDALFDEILLSFRVIGEPFLIEEWEGVDLLCTLSRSLSSRGKRKLMGFCAAGGTVIVRGEPLGLPSEISWENFLEKSRGRGI